MNSSSCCEVCIEQRSTSNTAARNHFNCLKYLHEKKHPWDSSTTYAAASYNSLDCLIYAHEHGCLWHINTIYAAAENGHIDCVLYAIRNAAPYDNKTAKLIKEKFGFTLEKPHTITDAKPNTSNDTFIGIAHKATGNANNELNNLVDMHLDQINQMETALHNAKDNFLTLKKNYESLQKEFHGMKEAYDKKCKEVDAVNDICENKLNANNEMIKSLQSELEKERLKNTKIMLSIKSIIE
jgi:hypothetical protein